jgi:uncharacterized protein YjdB
VGTPNVCVGASTVLSNVGAGTWSSSNSAIATVGSSSGIVTGMTPGVVTITYSVGAGCTATTLFTVNALPPAITPSSIVSICPGSTAALADGAPGGTWSSATGIAIVGSTGIVLGIGTGTANISYTNGFGCSTIKSVTVLTAPSAITPSGAAVCSGSTVTFSDVTSGGTWSSAGPGIATISGGVVTGVTTGTTTISYTAGGCPAGATVTVNLAPPAITPAGAVSLCAGATALLADGSPGGSWSSSNAGNATVSGSGLVTGIAAGVVNISYTNGAGCAAVKTVTVLITPPAITPSAIIVCTGNTTTLTDAVPGGLWSSNAPTIASVSGNIVTGVAVGNATITYTIGSCFVTVPVTVSLSANAGVIVGASTLCSGSTSAYTDASPGGAWSVNNPAIATVDGIGNLTSISGGTVALSYSVTNGCGTVSAVKFVSISSSVSAGTIIGTTLVCSGSTTAYIDTTAGGAWNVTNANAAISFTGVLTALTPGVDTVRYTVTNSCGSTSAIKIVNIGLVLTAGAISGPAFVCAGSSVTLSDPAPGGVWSSSNSSAAVSGCVVTGLTAGTDTISYTVISGCGSAVATQVIAVNPLPVAGSISGPSLLCSGFTASYIDAAPGGTWSLTNANATIDVGGMLTASSPGNDTAYYTVSNSCGTVAATAYLTIGPGISAGSISGAGTVCVGSAITLTDGAPGGVWSASNATASLAGGVVTGISPGIDTISYTVTSSCGSVSAAAIIGVNPLPVAGTISGPSSLCIGAPATYANAVSGGVWSSSNSSAVITLGGLATPLAAGIDTISYSVTNSCGTATATQLISILAMPAAGVITGGSAVCMGSSIIETDASPGGIWSASNSNATVSGGVVMGVTTGTDIISYTVSNSCGTAVATVTVTIDAMSSAGAITGPSGVCIGSPATLFDVAPGGVWSATNTNASVTISGIVTGVITGVDTIRYTVTNGCGSAAASAVITVSASSPAVGVIIGPGTVCAGSSIVLIDVLPGGTWSSSNSNATVSAGVVTGVTTGSSTISYTVTNGCGTASTTNLITIDAALVAGAISGPPAVCEGTTITLTNPVAGGIWSSSNTNATVSAGVVTGVSSGVSTISYTITGSCGSASATQNITIGLPVSAGTITGPTGVCAGATVALSNAIAGGVWSATNGRATVSPTGIITGVTAGMDTIMYTVSGTCGNAVASRALAVNSIPSAGSIGGASGVCPAASVTLTHSVSGGTWTSSNTGVATITGVGVVTGVVSGAVTISYTASNGCGHSSTAHAMTVLSAASCEGLIVNGLPGASHEVTLNVAPNPNNGTFTITLTSDIIEPVQIIITNIIGTRVRALTTTTNNATELQLGAAPGIYLLNASTANGRYVAKVIIN